MTFDEIRVFAGIAERTGVQFERSAVRHSRGCSNSVSQLIRKAREVGDGYFYLPLALWPEDTQRVELHKPWVVVSSLSRAS